MAQTRDWHPPKAALRTRVFDVSSSGSKGRRPGKQLFELVGKTDQPCFLCHGSGVKTDIAWDFTKTGMNFLT